jgi:hypothetical protein
LNGNLVLLEEKAPSFPDYPFAILNSLLILCAHKLPESNPVHIAASANLDIAPGENFRTADTWLEDETFRRLSNACSPARGFLVVLLRERDELFAAQRAHKFPRVRVRYCIASHPQQPQIDSLIEANGHGLCEACKNSISHGIGIIRIGYVFHLP